jgi:hypothetical protein
MIEFKKKIFNWLKAGSLACCCVIGCASQAEALSIRLLA